jgi:phosphocarrier protein HPr
MNAPPNPGGPAPKTDSSGSVTRILKIVNEKGLHARASAKFVQMVERFDANVIVSHKGESAGGNSIMGLMMLAAAMGTSITVTATGPQAQDVITALDALVSTKFGEEE